MDDATLFMHHRGITDALHAATTALANVGLQLNQTKTECWINDTVLPYATTCNNIPRTKRPAILRSALKSAPHPTRPRSPSHPVHPR